MSAPTLVEFLTARLDEDEAVAREALGSVSERDRRYITEESTLHAGEDFTWGPTGMVEATAARVLAEVASKRLIVRLHDSGDAWCDWCAGGGSDATDSCPTLNALAAVYEDHPDWRHYRAALDAAEESAGIADSS